MATVHFHFLTLFPNTITPWLTSSILGRAYERGIFDFSVHQLRDFALDRHRRVDDVAYGGGGGMVLKLDPLVRAVETICSPSHSFTTIYFSPAGKQLNQPLIQSFLPLENTSRNYLLICGHYEGVDQRFIDRWVDHEISLGDFVLTGGELPALAFADALIRQLEGVLQHPEAAKIESFCIHENNTTLLEHPHYTRPAIFDGIPVPEVLLSGDHKQIAEWRLSQSRKRTKSLRPDLTKK